MYEVEEVRWTNPTDSVCCSEQRWREVTSLKKQTSLSHGADASPAPSPVRLTWLPGQLHAVVQELVSLAHRTHVGAEVLQLDPLNGEGDAAGPVGHVIALAAILETFMFDVVTQQLVVGAPPLDGQLRERRAVLIGIEARQRDPTTWVAEDSGHSRYKQNRCSTFNREMTDRSDVQNRDRSFSQKLLVQDQNLINLSGIVASNVAWTLTATWPVGFGPRWSMIQVDSGAIGNLTFAEEVWQNQSQEQSGGSPQSQRLHESSLRRTWSPETAAPLSNHFWFLRQICLQAQSSEVSFAFRGIEIWSWRVCRTQPAHFWWAHRSQGEGWHRRVACINKTIRITSLKWDMEGAPALKVQHGIDPFSQLPGNSHIVP